MIPAIRLESLTFFRFIAAIIVVTFHYGGETSLPLLLGSLVTSGAPMVTFFFVLSGFVMMVAYSQRENGSVTDYYVSRFARILPVYLLALSPFLFVYSDPLGWLLSLTMLQAWFSPYPLLPNVPGWSLSVEMFFYLLFPWLLLWLRRHRVSGWLMLLAALVVYVLTQAVLSRLIQADIYQGNPSFTHDLIFFFPLSHLCSFLVGMAAGKLFLENRRFFDSKGKVQWCLFGAGLLMVYLALSHHAAIIAFFTFPVVLGASFFAPLFALLILSIVCSRNGITNLLARPGFVFLGEISYSIYILQSPVYELCKKVLVGWPDERGDLFFGVYLLLLMGIGAMVYRCFEMPCKRLILVAYQQFSQSRNHALCYAATKR